MVYRAVRQVIADDDLVLTQSEGEFDSPVACFDLFRVADGRIVEHRGVSYSQTAGVSQSLHSDVTLHTNERADHVRA